MSPIYSEILEWLRRGYTPEEEGGYFKPISEGLFGPQFFSGLDLEIEWRPHLAGQVEGRAFRGHAGLEDFARDMADAFEEMQAEIHELIPVGEDRVLVIVTWRFRGRGSGPLQPIRLVHLWTFRDGKATRMEGFGDESEARAVAGL